MKPQDLCQSCHSRSICTSLCPEAQAYVNQDEVEQKEETVGLSVYGRKWPQILRPIKPLSQKQKSIVALIIDGKSNEEICDYLKMSSGSFRSEVSRIREKLYPKE